MLNVVDAGKDDVVVKDHNSDVEPGPVPAMPMALLATQFNQREVAVKKEIVVAGLVPVITVK